MSAVESRVIRFHQVGEPLDVLQEEQTHIPDPGVKTIRIRVAATGLNPADWELCRGSCPAPCRAASVSTSPARSTRSAMASLTWRTAISCSARRTSPHSPVQARPTSRILNLWFAVPTGLDAVHAAVLPMVLQTAHWTLDLMNVKSGETVLIHGAGGMVGYAAVQLRSVAAPG